MKEKEIRVLAKSRLEKKGFMVWFPPRAGWYQSRDVKDIFGVFDLVAVRKGSITFIQLTTKPNLSARRKKIQAWYREVGKRTPRCYVWAWDKKRSAFKIENVAYAEAKI